MGEVYRARDPRLGRDVAIKVLPASFSTDADRLRRFEQEARAAGLLNHPNITAVYDIGAHDGAPYVVSELLEGETLRAELAGGRLSPRKAIDYAIQIAHGLAAAHEKGIVHRDLKPENVFVTKDGRVKILDFGLAKLTHAEEAARPARRTSRPALRAPSRASSSARSATCRRSRCGASRPTRAATSSRSARSSTRCCRASGRSSGDSAADTMSAILREDPPDLSVTNQNVSPGLDRIVRHCLEKNPEQRFQSARDLAFDLEALSALSGARPRRSPRSPGLDRIDCSSRERQSWRSSRPPRSPTSSGGAPACGSLQPPGRTHNCRSRSRRSSTPASLRMVRRSSTARRAGGNTPEIVTVRTDFPGGKSLGLAGVQLLSVSSRGELAVLTRVRYIAHSFFSGTLGRMPLEGGAPREVLAGVRGSGLGSGRKRPRHHSRCQRRGSPRVSGRKGPREDRWLSLEPALLSGRQADRVLRSPDQVRRSRRGRRRGPRRPEEGPLRRLLGRRGPRLVAGRERSPLLRGQRL